jgi:hypothetical protein
MKKFEKTYIGKGKQIADLDIIRISCKILDLEKLSHQYNGEDYITFEVARLQNPDSFGHTHTAYVNKLVESCEPATVQEPSTPKKTRKAPQPAPAESLDLPF